MTDVAVVGAGIAGLSTAYALKERGASVTVYERGVPGNAQSGGESRIFRHAHDDPRLVALACEARQAWREWEERFGEELLSRDGVVAFGPAAERRLALLREAGVRARPTELSAWLPVMEPREGFVDEDGGAIRARAAIRFLTAALEHELVHDEVLSVRGGEVRSGAATAAYDRVVVCAGRDSAALAGLEPPIGHSAHVRLTFPVKEPPPRLACLLDGEHGAYGDPLPGNAAYAIGIGHGPRDTLPAQAAEITQYVEEHLPGLDPRPVDVRHCWVTELPWCHDGIAIYEQERQLVLAGNNLFKHAPVLGRVLASAALGDPLPEHLRPGAELGPA